MDLISISLQTTCAWAAGILPRLGAMAPCSPSTNRAVISLHVLPPHIEAKQLIKKHITEPNALVKPPP